MSCEITPREEPRGAEETILWDRRKKSATYNILAKNKLTFRLIYEKIQVNGYVSDSDLFSAFGNRARAFEIIRILSSGDHRTIAGSIVFGEKRWTLTTLGKKRFTDVLGGAR